MTNNLCQTSLNSIHYNYKYVLAIANKIIINCTSKIITQSFVQLGLATFKIYLDFLENLKSWMEKIEIYISPNSCNLIL